MSEKKYAGLNTLASFLEKCRSTFAPLEHNHTEIEDLSSQVAYIDVEDNEDVSDENNNALIITEDDLPNNIPKIQSATVGQTIVVKSVDINGKPTEWECVDMASDDVGQVIPHIIFRCYRDEEYTLCLTPVDLTYEYIKNLIDNKLPFIVNVLLCVDENINLQSQVYDIYQLEDNIEFLISGFIEFYIRVHNDNTWSIEESDG